MCFDVSGPWDHFEDTPTLDAALAAMAACLSDLNLHPPPLPFRILWGGGEHCTQDAEQTRHSV